MPKGYSIYSVPYGESPEGDDCKAQCLRLSSFPKEFI